MHEIPSAQAKRLELNISQNASSRGAVVLSNFQLMRNMQRLNGVTTVKVLSELFAEAPRGMLFPRFHVLYEPFNRKLDQLSQAGIVQRLIESYYTNNMIKNTKGPEVLTLKHLELGFQIWLLFIVLSTIAFIAEIFCFH